MVGADRHPAGVGGHVVDAVRDGLAQLLVGEVVHVDPLGLPGRLVLPAAVLELPDQFLLLGVHRYHRRPGAEVLDDLGGEVAELGVPVGVLAALGDLGVALQAEPQPRSIRATVRSDTGCPAPVSASARLRVDLVVHTSGDIGSPRVSGSTSAFSAAVSPGSVSASFLRPPPGARTRADGSATPSSSRTPRATVSGCTPVASATTVIPPRPSCGLRTQHQPTLPLVQMRTQHRVPRATDSPTCAARLAIAQR